MSEPTIDPRCIVKKKAYRYESETCPNLNKVDNQGNTCPHPYKNWHEYHHRYDGGRCPLCGLRNFGDMKTE